MPDYNQVLYHIEVHSVEGIRAYFSAGASPNEIHDGIPLFSTMVEMYTRNPRFKYCVKAFVDAGLEFEDKALLAVLMDDADLLKELISVDQEIVSKTYNVFKNTYTPLKGCSLLHFCAEYNSIACARLLVQNGADVNSKASTDHNGFGGHTPVFHTVNQNNHNSAGMLNFLLENSADLSVTVKGIIWGEGYEWETFIPAVNPLSYAKMGLLPQMHRDEITVNSVIVLLLKYAYGIAYIPANIPCAYLSH